MKGTPVDTRVSFACERGNHVACDGCDCGCHEHPSRGGGK